MSHALIEFGPACQVVVEAVDQTAPRKREMRLPLAVTGSTTRSVVSKGGLKSVCNLMPSRMRRQRPHEAVTTRFRHEGG